MANIYSIGKSALLSANYAISVTGHNISNASVDGYNRQVVLQSAVPGQRYAFGFVGGGTQLDDVRRVYDKFLAKQFNDTQSESSRLNTHYGLIQSINSKLADATAGISPALQDFFSSVQAVASTPASSATRTSMISESEILAGRYNNLANQLTEQLDMINSRVIGSVELVNTYAHEIAKINDQIARAQIAVTDPEPNDLLDQRDYLISQLSQEIGVRTVSNGNSMDIYIGNGQPLVINNQSFEMYAEHSTKDPDRVEIGYINNGVKVEIPEKLLTGGNIKGYMEYRAAELDPVLNQLGLIAINLAYDFNAQHKLGQDMNGEVGKDYFGYVTETSVGNASGSGSAIANIKDVKSLVASNYLMEFDGTNYRITRQSDGTTFSGAERNVTLADGSTWDGKSMPVTIDGVEFNADGLVAGDSLVLKPLGEVASSLKVLITDPNKIAAALTVRTGAGENNVGSGQISQGSLVALNNPDATIPSVPPNLELTVQVDGAGDLVVAPNRTVTVTYTDGTTKTVDSPDTFAYEEGMTIALGSFTFNITGKPQAGDTFYVEPNTGGTGDNRNMLSLASLQDSRTMNGTTTYQGAYSQLVNRVGAKTRELEILSTSTATLLNEIYEEQQSESGVNLDEEAINLMRYQQNYNAATKVLQTANEMFDSILAIF